MEQDKKLYNFIDDWISKQSNQEKNIKIIGLTGYDCSGKSTLATKLINKYNFVEFTFATILKKVVSLLTDIDVINLERENKEKMKDPITDLTIREYFCKMGTLFRNNFGLDFWIKQVTKQIDKLLLSKKIVNGIIISDFRFKNEFEWLANNYKNSLLITVDNIPKIVTTINMPLIIKSDEYCTMSTTSPTVINNLLLSKGDNNIRKYEIEEGIKYFGQTIGENQIYHYCW
jgi:hypothetical protein